MRGRKPKPTAVKKMEGNPGKRALNKKEPRPAVGIPPCPDRLSGRAREIYNSAAEHTARMGVLTVADGLALEMLSMAADEYFSARDLLVEQAERLTPEIPGVAVSIKDGMTYKSVTMTGEIIRSHPATALMSDAFRRTVRMLNEFGLTPSSRSRLQGDKNEDEDENEFLALVK